MTHLEKGTQMHQSIEACLALAEAFRRFGLDVTNHLIFAVADDVTPVKVALVVRVPGKADLPFVVGPFDGTPEEAEAQWFAAATAWNKEMTDPTGLSRVERQVIWEMHMKQHTILSVLVKLVSKGIDVPSVPEDAVKAVQADLLRSSAKVDAPAWQKALATAETPE